MRKYGKVFSLALTCAAMPGGRSERSILMNILVCIKEVPDQVWSLPDPSDNTPKQDCTRYVINPFDRYALEAVKNAGTEGCISIVKEAAKKPFESLEDVCARIDLFQANKKTIESLVKAGAMDCLLPGKDPKEARALLLSQIDQTVDTAHLIAKEK